jgi:ribokinase
MDPSARPQYQLLCVGDILVDEFLLTPVGNPNQHFTADSERRIFCIPWGEKVEVERIAYELGGNAANVAVAAGRLDIKTILLSTIGDDWTLKIIMDTLAREGVGTTAVHIGHQQAGARGVVLNYLDERTIFTFHPPVAYEVPQELPPSEWVYLTSMGVGYESTYQAVIEAKKSKGVRLAFNPGSHQLVEGKEKWLPVLANTDTIFVNREEAALISGITNGNITELGAGISRLGPKVVVITDGQKGAYAFDGERRLWSSIYQVPVVERTGAGDAFAAGFLTALMQGQPLAEQMRSGMVESASVLTKVGAQAGLLKAEEMAEWLARAKEIEVKEI